MEKNFKNRINECRKRLGKNEFARKCNLKPATMLGYLNGTSEPNLKNLIQIARACNVTVGWLANGEQPKRPGLPVDNHDAKMLRKEMAANGKIAATIKGPDHVQSNGRDQLHPAVLAIEEWLKTVDVFYSAEFYNKFINRFPEFAEWLKKREKGNHLRVGMGEQSYRKIIENS